MTHHVSNDLNSWMSQFAAPIVDEPFATISAICFVVISVAAGFAALRERSGLLETVALAGVCVGTLSRAFFVFVRHEIEADAILVAGSVSFYCIVITWNYFMKRNRGRRDGDPGTDRRNRERRITDRRESSERK